MQHPALKYLSLVLFRPRAVTICTKAKMNVEMFIWFYLCKLTLAQINGEFWWLNDKLKTNSGRSPPKFEELSEFDTDESAKIIFNDNELFQDKIKESDARENIKDKERPKFSINFQDESKILWPSEAEAKNSSETNKLVESTTQPPQANEDVLEFRFPDDDNLIWIVDKSNMTKISQTTTDKMVKNGSQKPYKNTTLALSNTVTATLDITTTDEVVNNISQKPTNKDKIFNDTVTAVSEQDNNKPESESICTFLKKFECHRNGGVVYFKRGRDTKKISMDSQLVCCILPLKKNANEASKIHFIEAPIHTMGRHKRSNKDETSQALKQRSFLLFRRYGAQFQKTTTSTPQKKVTQKILSPDNDNVDPYWNIKNTGYNSEDYVEDYAVELPKPGLVGLYSDHKDSSWSFANGYGGVSYDDVEDDDDESDEEPAVGYGGGFLDPRLEDRISATTSNPIIFSRPAKLQAQTASSEELTYNAASHTINYQSNPDFNVLQGFKLLNLVSNKNRIYRNGRKTTTESVGDDSKESVLVAIPETDYDESFEASGQVHKDCGRVAKGSAFGKDKKIGETNSNSHPWLALVTLTKRRQTILCYATIVHTRAAVTTADCVHGRAYPGDVTLIAGAWDLEDENGEGWQKRMVSVEKHPRYTPGELDHNLAVLHWKRPLKLGARVQPACLADPHVGDDCVFVGWGGYDQDIRSHSRWQRASILTPRACNERVSSNTRGSLPKDAFCAAVPSRGTVTGIGGPLVCSVGGKHAAVGVAIWRDQAIVLTPPRDWTLQTLAELQLH